MGQRSADYESAREISRPSVRSGSSAFAARSVGDYTSYSGQYTSPTGFFAPTYTSDPFLSGRRNLQLGPVNVGFGFFQHAHGNVTQEFYVWMLLLNSGNSSFAALTKFVVC